MKSFQVILFTLIAVIFKINLYAQVDSARYWNSNTPLISYRLPPPPVNYKPVLQDLDGDGDPDVIRSLTIRNTPIMWIDDDDDMKAGDFEGDTDSDCLLIDVNKDGKYCDLGDVAIDWIDTDADGQADMQAFVENSKSETKGLWGHGHHYFWVLDTDEDNVFNYIDWNTFEVRAWLHEGKSNFLEDYSGQSTFLKIHASTYNITDIRLNWENPFLFYDEDNDGLSEMAIRVLDTPVRGPKNTESRFKLSSLTGQVTYIAMAMDLDNDNSPGNEFDFDMSFKFLGKGFNYMDQVHKFKNIREKATDSLFIDPRWRRVSELIYPDHNAAPELTYQKGEWDEIHFVYDEDDDCERWERVEFYDPKDLFAIGKRNGGLDDNPQADAIGDRGEWDLDNSGDGNIYISEFDGKIHLYGAEWGAWRVDQLAYSYQGFGGMYDSYTTNGERLQKEFSPFSTFKYEDTDNNGFIDQIKMDIDGDTIFEKKVSLSELGINDKCEIIDVSQMSYKDYRKLHTSMSDNIWAKAELALEVAKNNGLNTSWYAFMKEPKSENQKYNYGYWLQFYVYMDLIYNAKRTNKTDEIKIIDKAYFSGNWEILNK